MSKALTERGWIDWPSDIPRIQVDRAASSITYTIREARLPSDTTWLQDMRDQIARGLESSSSSSGAPLPIRFRVAVQARSKNVLWSKCLVIGWIYWACPDHQVWASADITLDVNGKLYHGAGHAESQVHGLLYNQGEVSETEMAAYLAIVEATRAALASTQHAHLITDLERQVALMLPASQAHRGAQ